MRATSSSLILGALSAALAAQPALSGGIPSPFADPSPSRPAVKKPPANEAPGGDDILRPDEIGKGGSDTAGDIERETLAPIEAEPAPAPPVAGATGPAGPSAVVAPPVSKQFSPAAIPRDGAADPGGLNSKREELSPEPARDGPASSPDLWNGMTLETIEASLSTLQIPPRSPALHRLFRRLMTADALPHGVAQSDSRLAAVRVEALDKSGLIEEASTLLRSQGSGASDPILSLLVARTAITRGDRDEGCRTIAEMNTGGSDLPAALKGASILVRAYCATVAGKRESAQLQVALARDEGVEESAGLGAIDAIATGSKPVLKKGEKVGPIDWRILELAGPIDARDLVETAGPGVLAIVSRDRATEPATRLAAAERAAQLNAISPADLAKAYREFGGGEPGSEGPAALAQQHAAMFQSAVEETTPLKKARLIRSFLDEARKAGLYWVALQMIAPAAQSIQKVPEIGWFAETGIETAIASGDAGGARAWAQFGAALNTPGAAPVNLDHWQALADLADPSPRDGRSQHLNAVQDLAARGRFSPEQLHRLATVLDALDIQVPIPLWELASRTPQPEQGFLPATGVLTSLAEAAKKKEFGHTVLLVMQAIGPDGAEGAHMISLGDSIRALRRAGLDEEARALALEALFMGWPRAAG